MFVYKTEVISSQLERFVQTFLKNWFPLRKQGETFTDYIRFCIDTNRKDFMEAETEGRDPFKASVNMKFTETPFEFSILWISQFTPGRSMKITWECDEDAYLLGVEITVGYRDDTRTPEETTFFGDIITSIPWAFKDIK